MNRREIVRFGCDRLEVQARRFSAMIGVASRERRRVGAVTIAAVLPGA